MGGRRWLTSVGLILIATGMLAGKYLTGDHWVDVVKWVFGIFATGNVSQRAVEAVRDIKAGKGDDPPQ